MASNQVTSEKKVREKKIPRKIEIKVKKEIIEKYERGVRVTDLAAEYKKSKSTISTILKHKETIKAANVARGVTTLTKQRPRVLEEVEKLLLVWLNEKQLAGDNVSEAIICETARKIHSNLRQKYPSSSGESDEFKASRGWFEKFRKRSGIHNVVRHGEAASSDAAVAEAFAKDFAEFVEDEGYVPQQVFNCDEMGLFWKKMPKRTYITQEEKAMSGHMTMKDRLALLLCANASGEGFEPPVVEEIVSMGKSMGLEVDSDDIEELVKDQNEELTTDELVALQNEQHKVLTEEQSSGDEDEREVIKSDELKDIIGKWNECQNFLEKHHPDKTLTNRMLNMMNDHVISHFRKVLMRRKRQVTLERFLVTVGPPAKRIKKKEIPDPEISEDETGEDEEIAREKTPEGEADSPSKK